MIGRTLAPTDINTMVGNVAGQFLRLIDLANSVVTVLSLAEYSDAALEAAPFNFSSADVADLRAWQADVAQIVQIMTAQATLAQAKDFRTTSMPRSGWAGN
jgi:hypothetical protein